MKLYDNIQKALSLKGINTPTGWIYDLMAIWKEWYRGNVSDFHNTEIKMADGTTKNQEILTMNMAKKVCEDYAKLLWTEKTKIELGSDKKTKKLWKILDSKKNSFSVNFPRFLEKVMALGAGATVEYLNDNETIIDYIEGDVIMPYKYTNSYINGIVVISREVEQINEKKQVFYTRLTYHEYDGKFYTVYNELYVSDDETKLGEEINFKSRYPNVVNPFVVETETPYFQVFCPNIANNYDTGSPLGISIFANAIDNLKAVDTKYDSFTREFRLGKKRIVVDSTSLKAKPNYNPGDGSITYAKYLDTNDEVYVAVEGMENQAPKEIDFTLRTQEHVDAINSELNWLSTNVGLGKNYYRFDGQSVKTATEVVSENSDTYRSKVHHQIIINDCLYDLVKAICELSGIKVDDVNIIADDSIIEDTETQRKKDREEVSMGAMSLLEYRMKWYGEDEETAAQKISVEADVIE